MRALFWQKHYKIIVIGDYAVGKTSFVQRYVQNSFKNDYKGTVGVDFALKIVKLSETNCKITVMCYCWLEFRFMNVAFYTQYLTTGPAFWIYNLGLRFGNFIMDG